MKKQLCSILSLLMIAGFSGCGDNKTKTKLIGTDVTSGTPASTSLPASQNPTATSVTLLYKTCFFGVGAGGISLSPSNGLRLATADTGGLPTPNALGEYIISDASGVNVKVTFKDANNVNCIMATSQILDGSSLITYASQSLASSQLKLSSTDLTTLMTWVMTGTSRYIPSMWLKYDGTVPLGWYTLAAADIGTDTSLLQTKMATFYANFSAFLLRTFPTTMSTVVSGTSSGAVLNLTMSSAMPSTGRPTNTAPATMTGGGSVTLPDGTALSVEVNVSIGDDGPIAGTQLFSTSTGLSGTMTFQFDGSMSGTIRQSGVLVATVSIASNGTGTYTDLTVTPNQVYDITDAKP